MRQRQTLDRLTATAIERMTDAQLDAVIGGSHTDYAGFTDEELTAIVHRTASPDLCQRFDAAGAPA